MIWINFYFPNALDFSNSFFELCITLKQWSQTPINKKGEGQFVFLRHGLYFRPQHGIILLHSSCPQQSNHTRASVLQSWSTNYKLANSCWYNQLKICFLCSNNINNYKDTTIIHKKVQDPLACMSYAPNSGKANKKKPWGTQIECLIKL